MGIPDFFHLPYGPQFVSILIKRVRLAFDWSEGKIFFEKDKKVFDFRCCRGCISLGKLSFSFRSLTWIDDLNIFDRNSMWKVPKKGDNEGYATRLLTNIIHLINRYRCWEKFCAVVRSEFTFEHFAETAEKWIPNIDWWNCVLFWHFSKKAEQNPSKSKVPWRIKNKLDFLLDFFSSEKTKNRLNFILSLAIIFYSTFGGCLTDGNENLK